MRQRANALFWGLVQREMDETGLDQRAAYHQVIVRELLTYHAKGWSLNAIADRLVGQWGLNRSTYYRHLSRARRSVCIP